jgi:hypothetical protein
MKKDNKEDLFLSIFVSEFVEIVSDLNIVTSINVNDEGQTSPVEMPLTVAGFVMDADSRFVYLSQDGEGINQALPIQSIKHIAIVDVNAKSEQEIDESDFPEDTGSYH